MYNIYINEKRIKEKEDKIKQEEKEKIIKQKQQSKQKHFYINFIFI
jgi:hypothetical protein